MLVLFVLKYYRFYVLFFLLIFILNKGIEEEGSVNYKVRDFKEGERFFGFSRFYGFMLRSILEKFFFFSFLDVDLYVLFRVYIFYFVFRRYLFGSGLRFVWLSCLGSC